MHILLVADGRSPITARWVQGLLALHHRVTLVSTYPCAEIPGIETMVVLPVAFGNYAGSQVGSSRGAPKPSGGLRGILRRFRSLVVAARYLLGPFTLPFYGRRFRRLVMNAQPDLVHALRIPFEGMLAAYTPPWVPLAVSIWGNDLTLHARRAPWMAARTRSTLQRANGLAADAKRDIRLGMEWGFAPDRPSLVVPGSGGIDLGVLRRGGADVSTLLDGIPADAPLVINPRGFRPGSVRNEVFFQSIPLIREQRPGAHFLCPGMAGQEEALGWLRRLKLGEDVHLLPYLTQNQLWELFMRSAVTVSVSAHDGTPNSLLEAMACGCFPVAGDIESLREWITPGVNGLLVDPESPQALAQAVMIALDEPDLRSQAAEMNLKIVSERANVEMVRAQIEVFYARVAGQAASSTETP